MNIILRLKNSNTLEFIKDYFTVIIAVPYLAGGILQFFNLTNMSMDLLKFFSLSQLLLDGILILIKLSLLYFLLKAFSVFDAEFLSKHTITSIIFNGGFSLASLILIWYFVYLRITDPFSELMFKVMNYAIICCLILFALMFSKITSIKFRVTLLFIFYFLFNILPKKESNIENFNLIKESLKLKHKNISLTYYNDQYLFFETNSGKSNNLIIIKKMDSVFKDE